MTAIKIGLVLDKTKPASTARCKICLTSFNVSSMGEAAVRSHMKGAKHSQLFKQVTTPVSVKGDTSSEHKKTFNNTITVVCIILLFLVCRAICLMLFKIVLCNMMRCCTTWNIVLGNVHKRSWKMTWKVMEFCDPTFVGTLLLA
jgi:hypothetical protein